MKIEKNGFYNISENSDDTIIIGDNINVVIFDSNKIYRQIILGENSRLEFYGYLSNCEDFNSNIIVSGENSNLKLGYFLFAGENEKIKAKISGVVKSSNVKASLKIISLANNDSFIDVDGILKVENNLKNVEGRLEENNLFLGESGKINSIPTLLVSSKDVSVSHSCKIEKISDEELFYLRSKGIDKQNSIKMILDSYIVDLFKCMKMLDLNFYENLIEGIKKKILNNNK